MREAEPNNRKVDTSGLKVSVLPLPLGEGALTHVLTFTVSCKPFKVVGVDMLANSIQIQRGHVLLMTNISMEILYTDICFQPTSQAISACLAATVNALVCWLKKRLLLVKPVKVNKNRKVNGSTELLEVK